MVCAHRSSVTTAINRLRQKGALSRGAEGFLILRYAPAAELGPPGEPARVEPTLKDLTDAAGALRPLRATGTRPRDFG
jgi:hypothetical protein